MRAKTARAVATYLIWFAVPLIGAPLCVAAMLGVFRKTGRLAPVPLTGSISFNEKMELLRRRGGRRIDVLAVGSSMTLNNLDSESVMRALPPGTEYFNAGSFGLKINQTRKLANVLVSRDRPKIVLLVCGPMDFYHDFQMPVTMDDSELDRFLAGGSYPLFVARHFDFRYYTGNAREIPRLRSSRTQYTSLAFDPWGGLALDIHYPQVDPVRWDTVFQPDMLGPAQYEALAAYAQDLHDRGIWLVAVQPPLRQAALNPRTAAALDTHCRKVEQILHARGAEFVDLHGMKLDDGNFADYSHLNAKGIRPFTDALMTRAKGSITARLSDRG